MFDVLCINSASDSHYVIIGKKDEVKFPEGESVILDVHPMATASFERNYNRSSIMWFHNGALIDDYSAVRSLSISNNRHRLVIAALTVDSAEEDGTEGVYTCKVCRNGNHASPLECREFKSQLMAQSTLSLAKSIRFQVNSNLSYNIKSKAVGTTVEHAGEGQLYPIPLLS